MEQKRTPAALARRRALLERRLRGDSGDAAGRGISPRNGSGPVPLSSGQRSLWFFDRWAPSSALYNLPIAWRVRGEFSNAAFRAALSEVVRRHEILRTVIAADDGKPCQVVLPPSEVEFPVTTVTGSAHADRERAARDVASVEAREPFDLQRGPLLRARSVRLAEDDHVVLVTVHHVVFDEWSLGVLATELEALYSGGSPVLPELPVQYADFALWQQRWQAGPAADRALDHWRDRLAGMPAISSLPTDRPRLDNLSDQGDHVAIEIPVAVADGLVRLSRTAGVTLFMTTLAAFEVALHRWSGETDLVVGTPIAGRTRPELEPLIGFFVNMLVLRTGLDGDLRFRDLLHRVEQTCLDAYEHQEVPFERLVEEVRPERALGRHPLIQVVFELLPAPAGRLRLPALRVDSWQLHTGTAKFDLSVQLTQGPVGLSGAVEYATDLFDRATIERFAEDFRGLLAEIAANPDRRLSELSPFDVVRQARVSETARTSVAAPGETVARRASPTVLPPPTPTEEEVTRIWQSTLGRHDIGREDDFFELGGNSLLAIQTLARIHKLFTVKLPLRSFFKYRTIRQLSAALDRIGEQAEAELAAWERAER